MHPVVARVTERIVQRSADTRGAYLAGIDAMIARKPAQDRMGCANLAHAYAALPGADKAKLQALIEDAHTICPYSKATKGNVPVKLTAV